MKQNSSVSKLLFIIIFGGGTALVYVRYRGGASIEGLGIAVAAFALASVISAAVQVADQWNRAVIRLTNPHSTENETIKTKSIKARTGAISLTRVNT